MTVLTKFMLGMPGGLVSSGAAFVVVPRWELSAGCARTGRLFTFTPFAGGAARETDASMHDGQKLEDALRGIG